MDLYWSDKASILSTTGSIRLISLSLRVPNSFVMIPKYINSFQVMAISLPQQIKAAAITILHNHSAKYVIINLWAIITYKFKEKKHHII